MKPLLITLGTLAFGASMSGCAATESLTPSVEQPIVVAQATTVKLDAPVHFSAPDGRDVTVGPGSFQVTAESGANLRLQVKPSGDALLLAAHTTEHDLDLKNTVALLLKPEQDTHLVLLQPGGAALDAIGSDSGVRTRGVATAFSKATLTAQVKAAMFSYTITPALTPWGFGPCVRPAGVNHMSIDPGSIQPPGAPIPVIWGGAAFPVPGGSCAYTTVMVTSPTALPYDLPNQRLHAYIPMYDHQTTPAVVTMTARHDYTFNWGQTTVHLPQIIVADGREPVALGMPQTVQTVAGFYAANPAGVPIKFELRAGQASPAVVATRTCTLRVSTAGFPSLTCP